MWPVVLRFKTHPFRVSNAYLVTKQPIVDGHCTVTRSHVWNHSHERFAAGNSKSDFSNEWYVSIQQIVHGNTPHSFFSNRETKDDMEIQTLFTAQMKIIQKKNSIVQSAPRDRTLRPVAPCAPVHTRKHSALLNGKHASTHCLYHRLLGVTQ